MNYTGALIERKRKWGNREQFTFNGVWITLDTDSMQVFDDLLQEGELDPGTWLVREVGLFVVYPAPCVWSGIDRSVSPDRYADIINRVRFSGEININYPAPLYFDDEI